MTDENDTELTDEGAVFIFGKSRFFEGDPGRFWIKDDPVLNVSCGDEHTALVTASGRVFTFGSNEWGQLGHGHTDSVDKPSLVTGLKGEFVTVLTCGRSHTLVGTDKGMVFGFGCNNEHQLSIQPKTENSSCLSPMPISGLHNVKMLSGGAEHSMALTERGSIYIWGTGNEGQLGMGERTECPTPTELKIDSCAICLSAGYYHSAFITVDGKLWMFGDKENGKLGLPDNQLKKHAKPQTVPDLPGKLIWVSCGAQHTQAVTSDGKVFSFGDGNLGQLGLGDDILNTSQPKKVKALDNVKVARTYCGENHTGFLAEGGKLYMCGSGRHSKLGLPLDLDAPNQFEPQLVPVFEHLSVQQVACGGCHTVALAVGHTKSISVRLIEAKNVLEDSVDEGKAILRQKNLPPLPISPIPSDLNPLDKAKLPEIDKDSSIEKNGEVQVRRMKKMMKRRSLLKEAEDDKSIRHVDSDVEDFDSDDTSQFRPARLASGELLSPDFPSNEDLLDYDKVFDEESKKVQEVGSAPRNENEKDPEEKGTPSRIAKMFGFQKKSLSHQSLEKSGGGSATSSPMKTGSISEGDMAKKDRRESESETHPKESSPKKKIKSPKKSFTEMPSTETKSKACTIL